MVALTLIKVLAAGAAVAGLALLRRYDVLSRLRRRKAATFNLELPGTVTVPGRREEDEEEEGEREATAG